MAIQDGTYAARPGQARVYENDNGSLVACIEMQIEDGPVLKSYHTLAKGDGTLMMRTIDNLKAWSGWDGTDPFWFVDNDLTGIPVEVVIENQPGRTDPTRVFPTVKWVNPPGGGGGGMAKNGDRRAILAKYGGKLRAKAGGVPAVAKVSTAKDARGAKETRTGEPAPVTAGPGALPCAPVHGMPGSPVTRRQSAAATATAPVKPAPAVSDMNTCWGLMCELRQRVPKAQLEQEWFAAVGTIEGKDQADMTPEEWGRVEAFIRGTYGAGAAPTSAEATAGSPVAATEGAAAAGEDDVPF